MMYPNESQAQHAAAIMRNHVQAADFPVHDDGRHVMQAFLLQLLINQACKCSHC